MNGTIRWDHQRNQWRADVAVAGVRRRKRFPASTPEPLMRAWIAEQLQAPHADTLPAVDALDLWNERWRGFVEGRRLPPPARGISWTIHGWRVQVMTNYRLAVKSFPKSGPMEVMKEWLTEHRASAGK